MKLTRELISAGKSESGGFTLAQVRALGVPMPVRGWPKKGWTSRMIGQEISDANYAEFLRLRGFKRTKSGPTKRPPSEHADLFAAESPDDFANDLYEIMDGDLS